MPYQNIDLQRAYQQAWIARRRAEYLEDKCCAVCGSIDRLEIDHVDPGRKVDHKIWSWAKPRREAELAKCQVLCHDHHMEKTLSQRRKTQHGQAGMYHAHRCRCKKCCEWKRQYDREYRNRKANGS